MKKIFTLLFFIVIALQGRAQITITENDLPKIGQLWVTLSDYTDTGFVVTSPGSQPQHWDYSAKFKKIDDTSEILYKEPGSVPFNNLFPGATMAIDETSFQDFYKTTSDGWYIIGSHISQAFNDYDTLEHLNPDYLLMPVPLSYDDSRSYNTKLVVTGYDQNITQYVRSVSVIQGDYYSDAYGSLVTPVANNQNVLRVQDRETEFDTTYSSATLNGTYTVFDTSNYNNTYYYFVGNAPQLILMEIDVDNKTAQLDGAYYSYLVTEGVDKIPSRSEVFTNVYPNPAGSTFTFSITGAQGHQLKIYNMVGECVETENVDGINSLTITNNLLSSGLYQYQVIDKAGMVLDGKKFVVQ